MYQTQFQNRGIWKCLTNVLIGDTAGDYADFLITIFRTVDFKMAGILRHLFQSLFYDHVPFFCVCRHQHIFFNVLFIWLIRNLHPFFRMHNALRVRQTGSCAHDDRGIILFAVFKRQFCKHTSLFAVRGFQHRHHCGTGNHPGVLLVLRTIDSRIVCCNQNQTAVYAGIGDRVQRISGNIYAYQLHGCHCTDTSNGCTDRNFHGNLFIW